MKQLAAEVALHFVAVFPLSALILLIISSFTTVYTVLTYPECISEFRVFYGEVELSLQMCSSQDQSRYNRSKSIYDSLVVFDISFSILTVLGYTVWVAVRRRSDRLEQYLMTKQQDM